MKSPDPDDSNPLNTQTLSLYFLPDINYATSPDSVLFSEDYLSENCCVSCPFNYGCTSILDVLF